MNYYDKAFRQNLSELLTSYRKMLEQASVVSADQNYNILVNEKIKKVDEALKIVKPSTFDFLTERKIEKLQTDEYLKQKAAEYDKKVDEVKKEYEIKLELAKQELRESIKAELKRERDEKKRLKKAKKNQAILELIKAENTLPDRTSEKNCAVENLNEPESDNSEDFPEPEFDSIE